MFRIPPEDLLPDSPPSLLGSLPPELVLAILGLLPCPRDILHCKMTCHRLHQLISANAPLLTRFAADFTIEKIEGNDHSWSIELKGRCGDRKPVEEKIQRASSACSSLPSSPLWQFRISTLLIASISPVAIPLLTTQLRLGKQHQIRALCVQNMNFENVAETQAMFDQIIQQKCQRLHLRNCHFTARFSGYSLVSDPDQCFDLLGSFSQFQVDQQDSPFPASSPQAMFGQWALTKFVHDMRHRMRPHTLPMFWDSPVPLESFTDNNGTHQQSVPDHFLSALGAFILNWLHHPGAPFFGLRLRHCPRNFCSDFAHKCAQFGLSHIHFLFPSLAHRTARIEGKLKEDECLFDLFSVREMPARPNSYCLISQMDEYF